MRQVGVILTHLFLLALAAVFLLPFAWMLLTSVKPAAEFFDPHRLLPSHFAGLEHYRRALTNVPLLRFLLNGVLVCTAILGLQLLTALPCAYALAKLRFRGHRILFALVLAALAVPVQVPAIPLYLAFARLHLLDSYAALILPFATSAFGIFLFRQAFRAMPDETLHAARLDGCGEFGIVWRILLPQAWPAIGAFAVISIVAHWNDLYWPMIVIVSPDLAPPPLGVMFFRSAELASTEYGALLAGGVMITAPLLIAIASASRVFLRGAALTGPGSSRF
jgi:multiple sugar transport system permease protein